jgi:hypothetical protein
MKERLPMDDLTDEEQEMFLNSTTCHICSEEFGFEPKVRDHDPRTGKFRGAAHRQCNAKYYPKAKIPITMHVFRLYDVLKRFT